MSSVTTLVSFNGADGEVPDGSLIVDANGDLFGEAESGGANAEGTVFEIANTATGYASSPTTLVSFNDVDGELPAGSLIADANGDLFGTTQAGGANGDGTVFEIANTATGYASSPTTLVSFNGTDGGIPIGGLIVDANGDLFGTTADGGSGSGEVFEIANTATGYASSPTTLVSFNGTDGDAPTGSLIADANGDLFGTAQAGGLDDDGTVFEIANTATGYASSPTTLVSFSGADGTEPTFSLVADANGDLFGTTHVGGADNAGTVFEIVNTATGYASSPTTLVSFDGTDGSGPYGTLIIDSNGDLLGTTEYGGADGDGTAFEIVNTATGYASSPTVLTSFNGTDGAQPIGGLVMDASGNLFGTAASGGDNSDGTVFEIASLCFLAGTLIATEDGETPVEELTVGARVRTFGGAVRPVTWIGTGRQLARPGRRDAATPVILRKGALADNVPHQDLRVTKGHSFYFDGVLIPVEFLVNHRSIRWDDHAREVTLYHVELDRHDVLLANGAPAESYRDDGNRWLFQNANTGWGLPSREPCAPVLTGGPVVDAVWRMLLDRTGPRPGLPLTDAPDLHLRVNGNRVDGALVAPGAWLFKPPGVLGEADDVAIASRAAAPQELGLARDPRCLGVAVRHIVVRQGTRFRRFAAADTRLAAGFYPFEAGEGIRWTDGDAALPGAMFAGLSEPTELVVHVARAAHYPDDGMSAKAS